jgi:hypothetical protein
MRTTVDLPDQLFRKIKALASLNGISLKEYINTALQHEVEGSKLNFNRRRVALPLVPSKSPGSIDLDGEKIAKIMEAEDRHVST